MSIKKRQLFSPGGFILGVFGGSTLASELALKLDLDLGSYSVAWTLGIGVLLGFALGWE